MAVSDEMKRESIPKRISNYEECDIEGLGVCEDFIAGGFDHLAVGEDYFSSIVFFLLHISLVSFLCF